MGGSTTFGRALHASRPDTDTCRGGGVAIRACNLQRALTVVLPCLFMGFLGLAFHVLYVNAVSEWGFAIFAAVIDLMMVVLIIVVLGMAFDLRRRRARCIGDVSAVAQSGEDASDELWTNPDNSGARTVDCTFQSDMVGGFQVRCYNTSCPRFDGECSVETTTIPGKKY